MSLKIKSDIDIEHYLSKQKNLIDNHLKKLFEDRNYSDPNELWDAVKYSLLNGGKRIRGILCIATYESIRETSLNHHDYLEDCLVAASSIELIHCLSLVHDDLPSMDNDDLRRGKPSCHKAFDEGRAVLAGDVMLSMAFQLLAGNIKKISNVHKLKLIDILANAFSFGLVPGQVLDLKVKLR